MTIGWGIIGTGKVADSSVAPAIAKLADGELVAAVGRDPAKAAAFAAKHGGRSYDTLDELLADRSVDIVYIATPNSLHAEQAIAAARAEKHVFCDKPLATNVVDAGRVVDACEGAAVKLGVNFQTRHHQGMSEVKDAIARGAIGEPLIVQCEVSPGRAGLGGWRADPELAGLGTINNLGVHGYDLIRYLLGAEIDEVTVLTDVGRNNELETVALALLRLSNNALAYVNANQAVPNHQADLTIYGSTGRVVGRSVTRPSAERGELTIVEGGAGGGERTLEISTEDAFDRSVAAFQGAVVNDEQPNPSGLDGLRSAQLTDAMARSAREGRTVAVER
jgi:1,5-anhydro-D-fructose reductase (1,5-anhydro-D-mannitol-forming)